MEAQPKVVAKAKPRPRASVAKAKAKAVPKLEPSADAKAKAAPKLEPGAKANVARKKHRGISHEASRSQYLARTGGSGSGSSRRFVYNKDDPESMSKALAAAEEFLNSGRTEG